MMKQGKPTIATPARFKETKLSVLNTLGRSHLDRTMFFDTPVDIVRYDTVKYPIFETLAERQDSYFWRPQEIALPLDREQFDAMPQAHKHSFTSTLQRQIILDSGNSRSPLLAFLPICSLPEVENWMEKWGYFEGIHNKSYTHIIRNVYNDPGEVFDGIMQVKEIVDCAKDISKYYDDLIDLNNFRNDPKYHQYGILRTHKEALWMALNAANALEGIRFYISFACSWVFNENQLMEGNAKIIKMICRDENLHLSVTQHILRLLPKDDPEFEDIRRKLMPEVLAMVADVVEQEKAWAKYVFKYGSILGLHEKSACEFIEYRADKCLKALGYPAKYGRVTNPLPWTDKYISGKDV